MQSKPRQESTAPTPLDLAQQHDRRPRHPFPLLLMVHQKHLGLGADGQQHVPHERRGKVTRLVYLQHGTPGPVEYPHPVAGGAVAQGHGRYATKLPGDVEQRLVLLSAVRRL